MHVESPYHYEGEITYGGVHAEGLSDKLDQLYLRWRACRGS
jgi:hypothetical protein